MSVPINIVDLNNTIDKYGFSIIYCLIKDESLLFNLVLSEDISLKYKKRIIDDLDDKQKYDLLCKSSKNLPSIEVFKYLLASIKPRFISRHFAIYLPFRYKVEINKSHHDYELRFEDCVHNMLMPEQIYYLNVHEVPEYMDLLKYCTTKKQMIHYHNLDKNLNNPILHHLENNSPSLVKLAFDLGYKLPDDYSREISSTESLSNAVIIIKSGANIDEFTFSYRRGMKNSELLDFIKLGYMANYEDIYKFITSGKHLNVLEECIKRGFNPSKTRNGFNMFQQVEKSQLKQEMKDKTMEILYLYQPRLIKSAGC